MVAARKWSAEQKRMIDECTGPEARKALKLPPEPKNDAEALEATLIRLAALSPLQFDRVRKAEAKALGVQLGTLDCEVEKNARRQP
jgi:hypothetical protein